MHLPDLTHLPRQHQRSSPLRSRFLITPRQNSNSFPSSSFPDHNQGGPGLHPAAIFGIAAGCLILVAVVGWCVIFRFWKKMLTNKEYGFLPSVRMAAARDRQHPHRYQHGHPHGHGGGPGGMGPMGMNDSMPYYGAGGYNGQDGGALPGYGVGGGYDSGLNKPEASYGGGHHGGGSGGYGGGEDSGFGGGGSSGFGGGGTTTTDSGGGGGSSGGGGGTTSGGN